MPSAAATSHVVDWAERGRLPDGAVRLGIRRLLHTRLGDNALGDIALAAERSEHFLRELRTAPLALLPEKANQQHYEVPAEFFAAVLGSHRKYSCCLWEPGTTDLAAAEEAALAATCEHAGLADGQRILELGCGWGSLSLWMASRFPAARITALSNSASQRATIEQLARQRGLANLEVVTAEFSRFATAQRYDRVVSVEMFEHLRNWPGAFERVARWLKPQGRFLMHVFVHGGVPYPFEDHDVNDWMGRHFFSGGMMPSDDLALRCQDHLRLLRQWRWDGRHYQRTAEAWLARMDAHQAELAPLFRQVYGADDAARWWMRWRMFFLAVSELFGYQHGQRWWVSHYLFEPHQWTRS